MVLPIYLAMTALELRQCPSLPTHCGFMACHFSSYGRGLSNIPQTLPENSLLIVNDRISPQWHDPQVICNQLSEAVERLQPAGLLLDLQRPFDALTGQIVNAIAETVTCPKAVTPAYLNNWEDGVLLPPVPAYITVEDHTKPWAGRKIWLELDTKGAKLELTENGCSISDWEASTDEHEYCDETLCCHYTVTVQEDLARFDLHRTWQDTEALLHRAKECGVSLAVGLYQQWSDQLVLFESKLS